MPPLDRLVGARVRRVDVPTEDMAAVTLARAGGQKEVLVLSIGTPAGWGLVPERPRGAPAQGFARTLRREIGNATVTRLGSAGRAHHVELDRTGSHRILLLDTHAPNLWLLTGDGRVLGSLRPGTPEGDGPSVPEPGEEPSPDALRQRGSSLLSDRAQDERRRRANELRRQLQRARNRLDRKIRAIEGDRDRAAQVPDLRRDASLLLANLHHIGPRDREATVTDWETDPPGERTLPIDPQLGAKAQADAWFHRARRLERGRTIAEERLSRTRLERTKVDSLLQELTPGSSEVDEENLTRLEQAAADLGIGAPSSRSPRAGERGQDAPRRPFRRFLASGDRPVLVGRSAADNDELTLHHARPHDLWLHARGQHGAHVIVPLDRGESCPPELLVDAATLAAHFSDARGELVVEVQYAPRRFVRKPKKAGPGSVVIEREKVIPVRMEAPRLARLLG